MSRKHLIFPEKFPRFPDSRQNLQIPGINLFFSRNSPCQSCHPPFLQLVQVNKVKHLLHIKSLMLLINSFVFRKLFYCSSVWGNTIKSNINKLQLAKNFAPRIVLGLKKFAHVSLGRRSLKWLNVYEKILFSDLVLVFTAQPGQAYPPKFH